MSEAFLKVVNMSISAGWLVLAVLALRLILKKAPKWVNVLLWGIVAVRLICPFSIESALSLIPSTETFSPEIMMDWTPEISTGIEPLDQVVNPVISTSFAPNPGTSANPLQILIPVAANLWLLGVLILLTYTAISYLSLRLKLRTAVILRDNIFQCETVSSPFVLGILKPKIYLPYSMDGNNLNHVVAHEQAHIKRKDHWWKPLGFLLLTVYWFNPLMWLAYILLCRDIELACDEKVIAELGNEQRADYTQALVACAVNRRMIAACPLAFGEVGVKERVKSVMNYKKPTFWIIVVALVVCVVVAVCFLTDPFEPVLNDILFQNGYYVISENEREVTLSVPKASLSDEIYTSEGYEFDEGEVVAYKTDSSTVYLRKVMQSNESVDQLYFAFDISYDIGDRGTILSIYSRVPGDQITFYGGLRSKDLRDSNTVYPDTVKTRGHGPDSQFWFYVSADACKSAKEVLQFEVVFNEIEYEADQRNRSFSMSGNNVSDLNPAGIVERILKAEGWKSSNVYVNADNFDLHVDADFNWMDSQAVRYFFSNAKKTYSSQLRIFPDESKYFLTERTEWHEQEQKFLLQYYLEAIKYLPQDAIQEMAPADQYIIQHREEGRPADYNRVITYSSEGVEDTDGWYIHLQIQPLHEEGGQYHGTGDEVLDVFYGESYGSVATPDNIAFGLYDLEGENAEITEVKLRNLHNGKDTVITDPADVQSIAEFFTKVQGANRTSSKGYYGGSYEVQLCNGSRTVLSIGFGDDDSFNCGDYGDGYPARYELWGVTRENVIRFLSQFDSSDFDWGLPMVLNAKLLEIHDGYFVVEPMEGSWELSSSSEIEVPMKNMEPSPEPQVGDTLEIEYDGQLQETYPARITVVYGIRVISERPYVTEALTLNEVAELVEQQHTVSFVGMTREAVHGYWGKPDYEAFGFFGDIYHVPDTFESIVFRYDESEIVTAVEIEYRNEVPGDALFIVEIRDREKEEHLNCAEAEELFFEDDEYEYYFNVIKSHYVIVTYNNANSEDIITALNSGRATIADLDEFDIEYTQKPKS